MQRWRYKHIKFIPGLMVVILHLRDDYDSKIYALGFELICKEPSIPFNAL